MISGRSRRDIIARRDKELGLMPVARERGCITVLPAPRIYPAARIAFSNLSPKSASSSLARSLTAQ
jgi:hypothetical protein